MDGCGLTGKILPYFLFRYRSDVTPHVWDELERVIASREFYFASAERLNDPFEIRPTISKPSVEAFLEIITKKYGKNPLVSRDTFEKALGEKPSRQVHRRRAKDLAPSLETAELKLGIMERTFSNMNKRTRIVCFNETPSSLPMWAHYANNHQGICLRFELNIADHVPGEKVPVQVSYSNERPVLDISDFESSGFGDQDIASDAAMKFATSLYSTKATDWSYEKEWRVFDSSGAEPDYSRISCIKPNSIILGINAQQEFREKVIRGFGNKIRLFEAKLVDKSYNLEFHPIN